MASVEQHEKKIAMADLVTVLMDVQGARQSAIFDVHMRKKL